MLAVVPVVKGKTLMVLLVMGGHTMVGTANIMVAMWEVQAGMALVEAQEISHGGRNMVVEQGKGLGMVVKVISRTETVVTSAQAPGDVMAVRR